MYKNTIYTTRYNIKEYNEFSEARVFEVINIFDFNLFNF